MKILRKIETANVGTGILTFNRQKTMLANGGLYHGIMIWNFKTGELLQQLDNASDYLGAIGFSPDGEFLVSATDDGMITVWRYTESVWKLEKRIKGEGGRIISSVMHSDNNTIAKVNSTTGKVEIWSLEAEKLLGTHDFGYVSFHPSQSFAAIREREYVVIVDYALDETVLKVHVGDNIAEIAFNGDGNNIATINDSGELVILDLQVRGRRICSQEKDYAIKFDVPSYGDIACVLYESGMIGIWDTKEGILKETAHTEFYQPAGIAISHQGDFIAVGSGAIDSGFIELWELG